jgi:Tol biopolymer transport system component
MTWMQDRPTRARLIRWTLLAGLLTYAASRFVVSGVLPATRTLSGDFGVSFPTKVLAVPLRPDFPTDQLWPGWQYGPMLHFLTLPLFLVPRWSMVPVVWAMINLAAVVASFLLVRQLASRWRPSMPTTAVVAAMWMLYQPLANCFTQGNIEILEMAITLGALVAVQRSKERLGGILIGVASMTKFLPVGFLCWFLLRRYYRAFLAGVATIGVIVAVTTVTIGWKESVIFGQVVQSVRAPDATLHNLTLTSLFLHRTAELLDPYGTRSNPMLGWFPSERAVVAARAGLFASGLIAAVLALTHFRRRHRPASPYEVAVLFMTMFMILPYNEDYYYVFALVPLSVLFVSAAHRRDRGLLAATLAAYVLISPPIPFNWIDRTRWLPYNTNEVFAYLDLPILGGVIVWIAAIYRMFADTAAPVVTDRRAVSRGTMVTLGAVAAAVVCAGVFVVARGNAAPRAPAVDTLNLQPAVFLSGPPALALSPNGDYLAYVARPGGASVLCVNALARAATTCLPGTEEAEGPFFSPDSRWIGFFAGGSLKKLSVDGQAVQVISESFGARVGEWAPDDTILMATPTSGIMRVPQSGTNIDIVVPQVATDSPYAWPTLLPSGDTVLFSIPPAGGGLGAGSITAYSFSTGRRRALFPGSRPYFDRATGRLSYTIAGRLLSVPFDPVTLNSIGPATPVASQVLVTSEGGPQVAYSGQGTVVYAPGTLLPELRRQMVWVDRDGAAVPLAGSSDAFQTPRVSPDGRTLVVGIRGVTTDLWKYDLVTGAQSRVTFASAKNDSPVWTPEGAIAFTIEEGTRAAVLLTPVGGTEAGALRVWDGPAGVRLGTWSAGGRTIVGTQADDLWILHPNGMGGTLLPGQRARSPRDRWRAIVARTGPAELGAVLSPDGRHIAYSSSESGRSEVYVQALPVLVDRRQVSTAGGTEPVWSRDGRELFYRSGDAMMAVSIGTGPTFSAGPPRVLFRGSYFAGDGLTNYDVAPDGRRFLMIRRDPGVPSTATPLAMKSLRVR